MNKRYEKPLALNLGDVMPNAEGVCSAGSYVHPGNSSTCKNGNVALNRINGCQVGSIAGGVCDAGTVVGPFAGDCINGRTAVL